MGVLFNVWKGIGSLPGPFGSFWFEAFGGGAVSPHTLTRIQNETALSVKKALGPNAPPQVVRQKQEEAKKEIELFLRQSGQHPDDASLLASAPFSDFQKNFNKGVAAVVFVVAVGLLGFFTFQIIKLRRR